MARNSRMASWLRSRPTALAVIGCLLLLAGCGSAGSGAETSDDDATAGTAQGGEAAGDLEGIDTIKVGLLAPLTGALGFLGEASVAGVETAKAVLEEDDGIAGKAIEVVTCDTETDPEAALTCYERVVQRDDVDVLIGPALTAEVEAVAPLTEEDDILTFNLGGGFATRDQVHRNMFAIHPVYEDVMAGVWEWARREGHETAWVLSSADATGEGCRTFFTDETWAEDAQGIEVLGQNQFDIEATSVAAQVSEIDSAADFVVICASGGPGIVATADFARAGLDMPAVTTHSQGVPFVAQAISEAVGNSDATILNTGFCAGVASVGELSDDLACAEAATTFVESMSAEVPDTPPDYLAGVAYDALMQIAGAIEATQSLDSTTLAEHIESTEYIGATGTFMDYSRESHRGLRGDDIIMTVLEDGNWHLLDDGNADR